MKKIGLMMAAVSLLLGVAAFAADQPKKERPASRNRAEDPKAQKLPPEARAVRGDLAQSPEAINKQLASLKQEHQAAINELEEIQKLANEEKATKTAGALDRLIARRNQEFQKRIEAMQQRLKKLEAQGKGGGNNKSGDEPKTEGGKNKPKGKNKGNTASKEQ